MLAKDTLAARSQSGGYSGPGIGLGECMVRRLVASEKWGRMGSAREAKANLHSISHHWQIITANLRIAVAQGKCLQVPAPGRPTALVPAMDFQLRYIARKFRMEPRCVR